MYKWRLIGCAVIGSTGLLAGPVHAVCTFGTNSEPSLQSVLDTRFGAGTVDAVNACIDEGADAHWVTQGDTGTIRILVELADNRRSNTFGIYDPVLGTGSEVQLFEGNDGSGVRGEIEVSQTSGQWFVRVRDFNGNSNWSDMTRISSPVIGFYLGTQQYGRFYSDTGLNADGFDHMYAYGPLSGSTPPGQYVIAWEDVAASGADRDYQDFVAVLRDITPVPLPPAAWLLISGLVGVAGISRTRASRN